MSIGQGVDSAFNMFQAMQRNRMARDELEYQRRQDALARADRLAEVNALAQYRAETLAQNQAQLAQQVAEFDAGADQRDATLALTEAQTRGAELANEGRVFENKKKSREDLAAENGILIRGYQEVGVVGRNGLDFNTSVLKDGIANGNKAFEDILLKHATYHIGLPTGSAATRLRQLDNGKYVIEVLNEDGTPGVVTVDGTSNPDSIPRQFTLDELGQFAEFGYKTGVLSNQDAIDTLAFRAMEGVIDSEADAAEIRSVQEQAAYQRQVIQQIPDTGAQRAAISAMSSATSPEEEAEVTDAIAKDVGIPPKAQALLEQRRQAQERGKLGGNKERSEARIAEIDAELAKLGFNSSGVRTEAANIVAATENASAEELSQAIESGQIAVTPEVTKLTADMLRGKGVEELQQLARLNNTERALAIAVMAASTPPAQRGALITNAFNIMETGSPSMSQKDVIDDNLDRERIGISSANLQLSLNKYLDSIDATGVARVDDAVDALEELRTETTNLFFDADGKTQLSVGAARAFTRNVLPELQARMRKIPRNADGTAKYPQEEAALMDAIHRGVSLSLASYADDFSNLADLFNFQQLGRGEAADAVTATDFIGNRIKLTYDNGAPDVFYFLDAEGNPTDRGVSASDIQEEDDFLYRYMIQAAQRTKGAR